MYVKLGSVMHIKKKIEDKYKMSKTFLKLRDTKVKKQEVHSSKIVMDLINVDIDSRLVSAKFTYTKIRLKFVLL